MNAEAPVAVCVMGPTASGKTELAIALADCHPFEIVSVDSVMIYRGMDIGSAKPGPDVLARYPHHLIDFMDPSETYSAADFRVDALAVMKEIRARGNTPLLTGGTMLYFKALREGLAELPAADAGVRQRIARFAEREGWPAVHARLVEVDAEAAARINPNDPQRLQRALEVYEVSGRSISELQREGRDASGWQFCQIAIVPGDRADLHGRIERRFVRMLDAGLIDEVDALRARGDLNASLPAIKAVGYRQVWAYLNGEYGYEEMTARAVAATRQLAKRQLTWLRRWPDVARVAAPDTATALKILHSASILA